MMRQTKFRGKRKDTGEWVYGYVVEYITGKCVIYEPVVSSVTANDVYENQVIPETVGQFTGLLDVNGKEIYENDFVRLESGRIAVVIWNKEVSAFCIKFTDSKKVGTRSLGSWINQLGEKIELYGRERFCAV